MNSCSAGSESTAAISSACETRNGTNSNRPVPRAGAEKTLTPRHRSRDQSPRQASTPSQPTTAPSNSATTKDHSEPTPSNPIRRIQAPHARSAPRPAAPDRRSTGGGGGWFFRRRACEARSGFRRRRRRRHSKPRASQRKPPAACASGGTLMPSGCPTTKEPPPSPTPRLLYRVKRLAVDSVGLLHDHKAGLGEPLPLGLRVRRQREQLGEVRLEVLDRAAVL